MTKSIFNRENQFKKTFVQIQDEWKKIQLLDLKLKHKAIRSLAYDILVSYEKTATNIDELEFYINILKQMVHTLSFPQKISRFISQLIADWLILTGQNHCEIILKVAGKISISTASIIVAEPDYFNVNELKNNHLDRHYLNFINQGKCYIFATGADGIYNVELRIVDSVEPVLTPKEFKYVTENSQTAIIHIPTGTIAVADLFLLNDENSRLSLAIPPGNYKICVYLFRIPKKIECFYIVLSKTEKEANNDLVNIFSFG